MKKSHSASTEGDERRREKELKVVVGEVVVNAMKKYKPQMEHETFKRYARECTELLVQKEKKNHPTGLPRHPAIDESKKAKMKAFTKEFAHKALDRLKAKGKLIKIVPPSNGASASSSSSSRPSGSSSSRSRPSHSSHEGNGDDAGRSPSLTATGTVVATPLVSDSWTPASARGSMSLDQDKGDSAADLVSEMFGDEGDDPNNDASMRMSVDGTPVRSSPSTGLFGVGSSPARGTAHAPPPHPPAFQVVTDSWAPKQPRAMTLAAIQAANGRGAGVNGHLLGEQTPQTPLTGSETSPPYGSN